MYIYNARLASLNNLKILPNLFPDDTNMFDLIYLFSTFIENVSVSFL